MARAAWTALVLLFATGCGSAGTLRSNVALDVTPDTVSTVVVQASGPVFAAATDLSRSPDGRLWVLDGGNGVISVWSETTGTMERLDLAGPVGRRILDPAGLDAGSGLGFQVADRATGSLYRFDHNGALLGGVSFRIPSAGSRMVRVRPVEETSGSMDQGVDLNPRSVLVLGADRAALLDAQRDALILYDGLDGEALLEPLEARTIPPVVFQGDVLLFSPDNGQFVRMDPTGSIRWSRSISGLDLAAVVAMAVVEEDVVLLSTAGLIRLRDLLSPAPSSPIRADVLTWAFPDVLSDSGPVVDVITSGQDIWILTGSRLWNVVQAE